MLDRWNLLWNIEFCRRGESHSPKSCLTWGEFDLLIQSNFDLPEFQSYKILRLSVYNYQLLKYENLSRKNNQPDCEPYFMDNVFSMVV